MEIRITIHNNDGELIDSGSFTDYEEAIHNLAIFRKKYEQNSEELQLQK